MRLALMQPYFIPYSGYFCLPASADIFVLYDCVQFPKEGWVHRNQLERLDGEHDWLTLPLKRKSVNTRIKDIEFSPDATARWEEQLRRFKVFENPRSILAEAVGAMAQFETPVRAIYALLKIVLEQLSIDTRIILSSDLNIAPELKRQDRVLAICEQFKATEYINASGGLRLYQTAMFTGRGIKLKILKPYEGSKDSILERLAHEKASDVRKEIEANAHFIS